MRVSAPPTLSIHHPKKRGLGLLIMLCGLLVAGCAPDRSTDDDDDSSLGTRLTQALFTVTDSGEFSDLLSGRLVLVDEGMDCSELGWGGSLSWWALDSSVDWVEAYLVLGVDLGTWDREFRSYRTWSEAQEKAGIWDYRNADYFSGNIGIGGYGDGDDDDDDIEDPPPIGREILESLGNEDSGANDRLVITSYSLEGPVSGYIQGDAGNYSFDAEHCGIYEEGPIDGLEGDSAPPPEPDGP